MTTNIQIDPNRRYRLVPDGINLLGISKALAYRKIKNGQINVFKDDNLVFIHGTEIIRVSRPPKDSKA